MKFWIQKLSILISAGVVYLFGQYFRGNWIENFPFLCLYKESPTGAYCNWPYFDTGLILIAAGEILAIAGLILLFANKEGLRKWQWMSLVYIPISIFIVAHTHQTPGDWISFSPSPEHVTWLLGYFYLLLTVAIVTGTRYVANRSPAI
ncbi:MAG: hypothetical protein ACYCPH_02760 [Minisyncoccota bacterium]